ncbi:alpha/beta fold hydrolase [Myxococcota bacterium]
MKTREYGTSGPNVVLLHGGPGVAGYMAGVARGLADSFRVLEPWQRRSSGEPLTVAQHIADLDQLILSRCGSSTPALVGSSWGAMLGLAYAAAHPTSVRAVVLIGCGTFDSAARRRFRATVRERMGDALRARVDNLADEVPTADERLRVMMDLLLPLYSHDLETTDLEVEVVDARAFEETWTDMILQQEAGVYPAAFTAIQTPVLMLHGVEDPHPGTMIRASLAPHVPQLEYREWPRCGHYPWLERAIRADFFSVLRAWLGGVFGTEGAVGEPK